MKRHLLFVIALALLCTPLTMQAQVARLVHYQGTLTDDAGNPLNGTVSLEFNIYGNIRSTEALWSEVHDSVQVTDGTYAVMLGSKNPLKLSFYEYFLGVRRTDSDRELERKMIVGSGYNYRVSFLFAAYSIVWVALFGYFLSLSRKQKKIITDLQQISKRQDKLSHDAGA